MAVSALWQRFNFDEMGCMLSKLNDSREKRRRSRNVGEIVVFVPGLRTPKAMDFSGQLGDGLSRSLVERLSALRTRIVVMAGEEGLVPAKSRRVATRHGLFSSGVACRLFLAMVISFFFPIFMVGLFCRRLGHGWSSAGSWRLPPSSAGTSSKRYVKGPVSLNSST